MSDIVKALRNRATWETATSITEPHEHIDWMAADEITSLRIERNGLWADKLKMQGEITRLREALKPFAERADRWEGQPERQILVMLSECRAAAAALRSEEAASKPET